MFFHLCMLMLIRFLLSAANAVFDASQYEFFGNNVLEEVELGGLEDDGDDAGLVESNDKNYQFFSNEDGEEVIFFFCLVEPNTLV